MFIAKHNANTIVLRICRFNM